MTLNAKAAASMIALALALPAAAHADPGDDLLNAAYNALAKGQYGAAISYSNKYLASHPHRYFADFYHAAGQCGLHPGSASAIAEITAVRDGYDLSPAAASDVDWWIDRCQPPVRVSAAAGASGKADAGSSSSALSVPPKPRSVVSSAPGAAEAKPRIHMGGLVQATSYSGDDYAHALAGSPAECSRRCLAQAPCRSMTYDSYAKICWLKRSVPAAQHGANFISSVKVIPWQTTGMVVDH